MMLPYSNNVINSYNEKNYYNSLNQKIIMNKNSKNKNSIISNNTNSISDERNKYLNNKRPNNDGTDYFNLSMKNYNQEDNSLNNKYIKRNSTDDNKIKNTKTKNRPLLFLDLFQNNKINNTNTNCNHIIMNTDSSLNSLIKVNIRLNKEFTPINKNIKKKKFQKINFEIPKKRNINKEIKDKFTKIEESKQNLKEISKIIFIQKWWKNYYFQQIKIIKIENFINRTKKIIYKNIMRMLYLYYYNMKYYILKWSYITFFKNILQKIIINKKKYLINQTIDINQNLENICLVKPIINRYSNLGQRSPTASTYISQKIHNIISQQKKSLNNNNKKIYSKLNKKNKNKLIFNTIDTSHKSKNKIKDSLKAKEIKTNNIIKAKKINLNKNAYNKNNNKFINYKDNKLTNLFNNKTFRNKIPNIIINKNNEIFFNDICYNTNNYVLLNTEQNYNNSLNTININNNIPNTINISKRKSKIIKGRYFKLKKFETCPLSFKNKKYNLYKKLYVKKYLSLWNIITIKSKILFYLIKASKQIKLKIYFYKYIKYILLKSLKMILLNKYFIKYKDIIIKRLLIRQLKAYKLKKNNIINNNHNNYNDNLKVGDIINNININNFINYTNFIPKTTKNCNIVSNSANLNSNNSHSYYKSHFQYFKNFNNREELNLINNNNSNFKLNNNYNLNSINKNENQLSINVNKKNKILVDQINQFKMIFNLLEQHYKSKKLSLINYFNKWKKYSLKNSRKKNKIKEKIINFRKINIQNINNNKHNQINDNISNYNNKNTINFNKYDTSHISFYTMQTKNEIKPIQYIKIKNNNKKNYSSRESNNINNDEIFNNNSLNRNNNKKIRYIDINKNIFDYSSESSIFKNNINSEIIYHKKILYHNHISNMSNLSSNFKGVYKNKYGFKKINQIEEREVHFNSLSKNKNSSINKEEINNLFNHHYYKKNYYNNNIYANINDKCSEDKIKNNGDEINDNNIYIKGKTKKINLFNDIKNLFIKTKKMDIENKKVNQTFCGFPFNFQDEID